MKGTCISLPDSCIRHIFEYLEDDMCSLHSCLLVNRVWCTWAVGILWSDTERYLDPLTDSKRGAKLFSTLLRSLIAHAGKNFLPNDGTIILEDIYHLPLPIFNYPSFIRVLSAFHLDWVFDCGLRLKKNDDNNIDSLLYFIHIIKYNFYQMLMKLCPPFKKLDISKIDIPFLYLSGARKCFSQIYELHCDNTASPHLYYHLASMCFNKFFTNENDDHNKKDGGFIIRKLIIKDLKSDNRGLAYLISLQKYLECVVYGSIYNVVNLELHKEISKALIKVSSSIKYFTLTGGSLCLPPETIGHFSNLIVLEILVDGNIEDIFQNMCISATFKGLEILRIGSRLSSLNILSKFLTKFCSQIKVLDLYGFWPSGKKQLSQLNETIAQYCYQNLHYLTTSISDVKDVRQILVSCEQLEGLYLVSNEKEIDSEELFRILVNHYPAKFSKLCLFNKWDLSETSLKNLIDKLLILKRKLYLYVTKQDELDYNSILYDEIKKFTDKNIDILIFKQIKSYCHWKSMINKLI
nr:6968_t:CDS:1 [Entrophospora candida]